MRWLTAALLVGCGGDGDFDGFRGDDCDDDSPTVYPGAPDLPGDGIDADCDGADPPHPFYGTWRLDDIAAEYFSLDAVNPDETSGTLEVSEDGTATLESDVALRAELIGFDLTIPLVLTGNVSAAPGDGRFELFVEGIVLEEAVYADWSCTADDVAAACAGALKALEITLDVETGFSRL